MCRFLPSGADKRTIFPDSFPGQNPWDRSGSDAAGERKDLDTGHPCSSQHSNALANRAASGQDIVDEQNAAIAQPISMVDGKGAAQVVASAAAAETGLGHGWPAPHQQVGIDPVPPPGKTGPGDEQGLIETAPTQARGMQGNRQNQVWLAQVVGNAGETDQAAHGGQGGCPAQEFQILDQAGYRAAVEDSKTSQVKAVPVPEAVAAKMVLAAGKGQAAARTAGRATVDQGGAAVGTEQGQPGRGQLAAAPQAEGGKEEIPGAREQGGRQGVSGQADHMLSMMAWPKAEQESLDAPSMSRARS